MTTRIFFDLSGYDATHRTAWEQRLQELAPGGISAVALTRTADDADVIIETLGRQSFIGGHVFRVAPESHYHRRPEATFVWDAGDFPTGRLPGLHCSLSRDLFDAERHRSFCYPLRYNPHIRAFPTETADRLFGFCGNSSSPLRHRLFSCLAASAVDGTAWLHRTDGIWDGMFHSGPEEDRRRYAEILRRSRFFLCPRGNGLSSIRLFETMEAGRVPVILSDALVLPQCVDWSSCAIVWPENRLTGLPAYLRSRESEWPELARRARQEWEANFSDANLLRRMAAELEWLRGQRRRCKTLAGLRVAARIAPAYAASRFKSLVRRGQRVLKQRPPRSP